MIKKNVEIVSLIYRSVQYLDFIMAQMSHERNLVPGWDVTVRIVANNPTVKVLEHLKASGFPYSDYQDKCPGDFYMNRIYRAYNWAMQTSDYDNVVLCNSDMGFSDGWLANLLKHHDGVNIPCSRLVESGRLISHNPVTISKNFGWHPKDYDEVGFLKFAAEVSEDRIVNDATYMPCVFEKKRFIEAGMFPEGNLYHDWRGSGKLIAGEWGPSGPVPTAARSADEYFMNEVLGKKFGMKQITVMNSIVYHTQSGEMCDTDV